MYQRHGFRKIISTTKDILFNKKIYIPATSNKAAVIVETRCNEDIKYAVYNHMYFLDGNFSLYVVHSVENESFIKEKLKELHNIHFIKLNVKISTREEYSSLLLSEDFYTHLKFEHLLIFQCDSLMVKKWDTKFNDFDYIGAPWKDWLFDFGGNGGFSYRSKKLIDLVLQEYVILYYELELQEHINLEDVVYSKCAKHLNLKVNNIEEGKEFSVESLYYENTMAMHSAPRYISYDKYRNILAKLSYD